MSLRLAAKRNLSKFLPPRSGRSIVLLYHSVGLDCPASIPITDFIEQIAVLQQNHTIVPLDRFLVRVKQGETRLAALTFDDGYEDNHQHAFMHLQRNSIPFTVFLTTAFVLGGVCDWGTQFRGLKALSWEQIEEMSRAGVAFGSHMHHHLRWVDCSDQALNQEIVRSTELIEAHITQRVRYFAYPYGVCDDRCAGILRSQSIEAAFTGVHRSLDKDFNDYRVPRLSVNAEDSLIDFKQSIGGRRDALALFGRR